MSRRRNRQQQERSRIFAGFLAILFGWSGAHKFYLRDGGTGVIYLLILFTVLRMGFFPITVLLGFMDAMRLFTMSDQAFDEKYNPDIERDDYYEPRQRRSQRPARRGQRQETRRSRSQAPRKRPQQALQKANPFKKSGLKKYKEFDLEGAIEDFDQGLQISPDDVALHFNLACAYSLTENKDKSFFHLDKAVSLGYNNFDKITSHDDLAYLRIQPEFDTFKDNNFRINPLKASPTSDVQNPAMEEVKDDVLLSQLNKLAELRKKGLLSENEFQLERKKLLRR